MENLTLLLKLPKSPPLKYILSSGDNDFEKRVDLAIKNAMKTFIPVPRMPAACRGADLNRGTTKDKVLRRWWGIDLRHHKAAGGVPTQEPDGKNAS